MILGSELLFDTSLSMGARFVLLLLFNLYGYHIFTLDLQLLIHLTGKQRKYLLARIQELLNHHFLSRHELRNSKGQITGIHYNLYIIEQRYYYSQNIGQLDLFDVNFSSLYPGSLKRILVPKSSKGIMVKTPQSRKGIMELLFIYNIYIYYISNINKNSFLFVWAINFLSREKITMERLSVKHPSKTEDPYFLSFWNAYPKKIARQKCADKWRKLKITPDLARLIMIAIHNQKHEKKLLLQYNNWCPNWPNPLTWLNQARWEDECESEVDIKSRIKNNTQSFEDKIMGENYE